MSWRERQTERQRQRDRDRDRESINPLLSAQLDDEDIRAVFEKLWDYLHYLFNFHTANYMVCPLK